MSDEFYVHDTAVVDDPDSLSPGCMVWHFTHVAAGAKIGPNVMLGQGCYIDKDVEIGQGCRVQNGVSIYRGTRIGDYVFIGPNATFTNARLPKVKRREDDPFIPDSILVEDRATIGANVTLVAPLVIGESAFVAAGSVVTHDVLPYTLVMGTPAKAVSGICSECLRKIPLSWASNARFNDPGLDRYVCDCGAIYMKIGKVSPPFTGKYIPIKVRNGDGNG